MSLGWFDMLLGRESKEPVGPDEIKKSWQKGWDSNDTAKQVATTHAYLEAVGKGLELEGMRIVPNGDDGNADLRGNLRGFPLKVTVRRYGHCEDIELKIGDTGHMYMNLAYDPAMPDTPVEIEPFEPADKKVILAPRVFLKGGKADEEENEFRKLPAELQARVLRLMPRLGIRYFYSSSSSFSITLHEYRLPKYEDPVPALVDTLKLAVEVAIARGQVPPGKESTVPKQKRQEKVPAWVRPLADSIAQQVVGSKIVEKPADNETEIRWMEDGVPVRISIDHTFENLDFEARADGVNGELILDYDADVTIEANGDSSDPWDEIDHHVFFAKSVFINGREAAARAQAAVLQSLDPAVLSDLVHMLEETQRGLSLDDQVLYMSISDAHHVSDGGNHAVRVAKIMARVAKALPRGEVPIGATAVRCTYCHGLWFPSPAQVTCSHCGARA